MDPKAAEASAPPPQMYPQAYPAAPPAYDVGQGGMQPQPGYPQPPPQGYAPPPQGYAPPPQGYAQPAPGYQPVPQGGPPPPPGGVPAVVVVGKNLGPRQATVTCGNCNATVSTTVDYETGTLTWLLCIGLCLVGCDAGCCLIPFCVDDCKDAVHKCPNCQHNIGRFNRM